MRGCRIVSTVMNDQTNKPETAGETGSETEAILGCPAEARQDPDLESADPKFRVYYERLLRLRNDLSNKRDAWREQELEAKRSTTGLSPIKGGSAARAVFSGDRPRRSERETKMVGIRR